MGPNKVKTIMTFWCGTRTQPSTYLSALALGVLLQTEGSILGVESRDEGIVEGGSTGGSGHQGHEGGLAGVIGGRGTGGQGASVLLEAVVLLVQLFEHLEDDAEVDVGVGDVDLVLLAGDVAFAADADELAGGDGADGGGDASDDGGGSGADDGGGRDGRSDDECSENGLSNLNVGDECDGTEDNNGELGEHF
jgi:hypothetical protein